MAFEARGDLGRFRERPPHRRGELVNQSGGFASLGRFHVQHSAVSIIIPIGSAEGAPHSRKRQIGLGIKIPTGVDASLMGDEARGADHRRVIGGEAERRNVKRQIQILGERDSPTYSTKALSSMIQAGYFSEAIPLVTSEAGLAALPTLLKEGSMQERMGLMLLAEEALTAVLPTCGMSHELIEGKWIVGAPAGAAIAN